MRSQPLLVLVLLGLPATLCVLPVSSASAARKDVGRDEAETHLVQRVQLRLPGTFTFTVPVTANVEISASGEVTSVEITSTTGPELDRRAAEVIRQWKYRPWFENGVPVPVASTISMDVEYVESWRGRISTATIVLLVIACGNLMLLGIAAFSTPTRPSELVHRLEAAPPLLALGSQILYLGFTAAWVFRWMRFYPGNPIQGAAIFAGMVLSASACLTAAVWAAGIRRYAAVTGGVVTAGLWFLAAVASVAV